MIIEKVFNDICENNKCDYSIDNYKVPGQIGSFIYISKHYLTVFHNNCKIYIKYDFGNSDTATYNFEIIPNQTIPSFNLEVIDHFSRLLFFKKSRFKLNSESSNLKREILYLLDKKGLIDLMNNTAFEPSINGNMKSSKYTVKTFFSLNYDNHLESIKTILEFHKDLIDLLLLKY